jgi:hypothetical protein
MKEKGKPQNIQIFPFSPPTPIPRPKQNIIQIRVFKKVQPFE